MRREKFLTGRQRPTTKEITEMKTKRTLAIAAVLVALVALLTLGVLRGTRQVQAQDQTPPPVGERLSLGMIGIARGQTARLNVTNAGDTHGLLIDGRLVDGNGDVLLLIDGQPVQRTVTLEPGQSASLQIRADNFLVQNKTRLNFRAEVTVTPPSDAICPCNFPVTLEVIDNTTGRTELVLSKEALRQLAPSKPQ
jgi:hypothetical protein